jgi:hypothetical protein
MLEVKLTSTQMSAAISRFRQQYPGLTPPSHTNVRAWNDLWHEAGLPGDIVGEDYGWKMRVDSLEEHQQILKFIEGKAGSAPHQSRPFGQTASQRPEGGRVGVKLTSTQMSAAISRFRQQYPGLTPPSHTNVRAWNDLWHEAGLPGDIVGEDYGWKMRVDSLEEHQQILKFIEGKAG